MRKRGSISSPSECQTLASHDDPLAAGWTLAETMVYQRPVIPPDPIVRRRSCRVFPSVLEARLTLPLMNMVVNQRQRRSRRIARPPQKALLRWSQNFGRRFTGTEALFRKEGRVDVKTGAEPGFSAFAADADGRREAVQHGHRVFPAEAGVGDRLAARELREVRHQLLVSFDEIGFDHRRDDGP